MFGVQGGGVQTAGGGQPAAGLPENFGTSERRVVTQQQTTVFGGEDHRRSEVLQAAAGTEIVFELAVGGESALPMPKGPAGFTAGPPEDAQCFVRLSTTGGIAAVTGQGFGQFQAVLGSVETTFM